MATQEERHSTRGRSRLLFEMLQGELIDDGWRSDEVREALELCLACKGCRKECPVQVDMATYKAEFLFHHYAGRLRPRSAYALGLVRWWVRIAAAVPGLPGLVNGLARLDRQRLGGRLLSALAGLAPERPLPTLAPRTFRQRFAKRSRHARSTAPTAGGRRVILWPDTFHDHFLPRVPEAALRVLEAAGFEVALPPKPLCCGRPLYDHGFLGLAERTLRRTVAALRPEIRAGVPVVGLEPSCIAVFRDELPNLVADDPDALRLSEQTLTLAELLDRHAADWEIPPLGDAPVPALVHGHCHQRSVMTLDAARRIWHRLGLDAEVLESGCCGMAGAFGYLRDKLEISLACAERSLAPAIRGADAAAPILTDGFSCRTQIEQTTGRRPLHLAEMVAEALSETERARNPT